MIRLEGFCPMGCGQTLYAEEGRASARTICLGSDCPRPLAAQEILSDGETGHVVTFRGEGFTIRHPLRERLGDDLTNCLFHRFCESLPGPPDGRNGSYRVHPDKGGWTFEEIE